jgi:hypothetical protein
MNEENPRPWHSLETWINYCGIAISLTEPYLCAIGNGDVESIDFPRWMVVNEASLRNESLLQYVSKGVVGRSKDLTRRFGELMEGVDTGNDVVWNQFLENPAFSKLYEDKLGIEEDIFMQLRNHRGPRR